MRGIIFNYIFIKIQTPLQLIDSAFVKDTFDIQLLVNELKEIKNIFDIEEVSIYVIERKEKMEIKQKLIEHYLHYLVQQNFQRISKLYFNTYILYSE